MAQKKYKRTKFFVSKRMFREVTKVLEPYGGRMTDFTERAVGVVGDARIYGPGVVIELPDGLSQETISKLSTDITNRVRGIVQVLMEVKPSHSKNN
jgi:GMP synthase PP-ATPase subunit